ncbi:hypothetical protein V8C86DRAFT_3129969, partial [Haematococcus lacustris]
MTESVELRSRLRTDSARPPELRAPPPLGARSRKWSPTFLVLCWALNSWRRRRRKRMRRRKRRREQPSIAWWTRGLTARTSSSRSSLSKRIRPALARLGRYLLQP